MRQTLKVKVEGVELPSYAHTGDAGLDLRINERIIINPRDTVMAQSGVSVAIPEGCVGLVFPRSGLASKENIRLANCVGVVDSGYRGEIGLPLTNDSDNLKILDKGSRVAQLVVMPYMQCSVEQVDSLDETERGLNGFGSTGVD